MYTDPTAVRLADLPFNPNSRPRNKLKQIGGSSSYLYPNRTRPRLERLLELEQIALYDTTVSFCLFTLIDTTIASLGDIQHPDAEIERYLRYNIDRMGGLAGPNQNQNRNTTNSSLDAQPSQLYASLYRMLHCMMWAGYSVSETLYTVDNGNLYIEDFATYHPATIVIRPNAQGRLVEGEYADGIHKSGIYQATRLGEQQLPMWKVVHLARSEFYGNYYGVSIVEPIYKWYLLKEAFIDMLAVALDRFGNPIVAITVPVYNTGEKEIDPATGEEKPVSTQQLLERQFANQNFSGGGNVLLLPQLEANIKPEVKVLTTGNNIGSTFQDAVDNCDKEISKGLLTPYGFLSPDHGAGRINQRQMELFNRVILALYRQTICRIVSQSFHRLVKMTFNRESANIAPTFPLRTSARPEDNVALMQMISGLTEHGYFNPTDQQDWRMVRDMVNALDRDPTPEDVEFAKTLLVYPRMATIDPEMGLPKSPLTTNVKPSGVTPKPTPSSSSSSSAKGTTAPSRDRSTENNVRGKGTGAGRPSGTSAAKLPNSTPAQSSSGD